MPKPLPVKKRLPNPTPVDPVVGRTFYLFDAHEGGVVSAVCDQVDGDRVVLLGCHATYAVDRRSLFDNFNDCAVVNGIAKRERGRPRATVDRPQRTLGRVAEADWQTLQEAARIAGQTFTEFALSTLLARARRVIAAGKG